MKDVNTLNTCDCDYLKLRFSFQNYENYSDFENDEDISIKNGLSLGKKNTYSSKQH